MLQRPQVKVDDDDDEHDNGAYMCYKMPTILSHIPSPYAEPCSIKYTLNFSSALYRCEMTFLAGPSISAYLGEIIA